MGNDKDGYDLDYKRSTSTYKNQKAIDAGVDIDKQTRTPLSSNIKSYEFPKADIGDNYPRHMRVHYIFRCF